MCPKHLSLVAKSPEANSQVETKKKNGWVDPKDPWVYWFFHNEEKRFVNFKDLTSLAKRKATQKKRSDLAEDFSQWCVCQNLERINRGTTEYAHLNDLAWLWSEYSNKLFGTKKRVGLKWEVATKTVSYDNLEFEGGGHFLDFQPDNTFLNPYEAYELKQNLSGREPELKEALRDIRKENREKREATQKRKETRIAKDNHLYDLLVLKSEGLGMGVFVDNEIAQKLGTSPSKMKHNLERLQKRGLLVLKNGFFYLTNVISELEKKINNQDKAS